MAYDPANPYKDQQGSASPYDYLRNKATQDAGNQQAQGLDSLTRRFASMGNLNSGAYTKAIEDNSRTAATNAQNAQGQVDLAENAQALPYAQMAQQGSQFGQSLAEQQAARNQQGSQFSQELPLKSRQLDLEASQQGMDEAANQFNERMGTYQANHSGGMFGQGGFLGMGNNGQLPGWQNFGGGGK